MFDGGPIFGLPPGADLPRALVEGLRAWAADRSPEALARVTVFVNSRRMERRVRAMFDDGPACLLPRIRLVTDIGKDPTSADLPPSVPPIRRRLELARLVSALIAADPSLAPEASAFDLAESLAALMDELEGEDVDIDRITALDISDASGHWQRSQRFLSLVGTYLDDSGREAPDPALRLRLATDRLIASWDATPPSDPVIVAGSTGSRGTTRQLMEAVARLKNGALLLPGYDFDLPEGVWSTLTKSGPRVGEDHPQYRFASLRAALDHPTVTPWPAATPAPTRNAVFSLSLRPAPVTDQWLRHGPALGDLPTAMSAVSLIEAPDPRTESQAIALALRDSADRGETAALISPDRSLTRRVSALLDRWGIEPDDSAGRPLGQSAPGRLLRQIAALSVRTGTSADLLALLKHPLVATGSDRGQHLLQTRELELWARAGGMSFADRSALSAFAKADPDWLAWLTACLPAIDDGPSTLADRVTNLLYLAETICAGPDAEGAGELWEKRAGRIAWETMQALSREAGAGAPCTAAEFDRLLTTLLAGEEVRDPNAPDERIMIWGTLEARVQGADLVILGGLNEGSWPATQSADPWLNRTMRAEVGLLLPERRIGLAAHDYQQAAAAPKVILSRAIKEADAQPVPSRWLNRLTNLLSGLPDTGGDTALKQMRERGDYWLRLCGEIDRDPRVEPAPRPAPCPPVQSRPRSLYVTDVEKLVRDPYAIYAKHVLGLRPLDPLRPAPDPRLRGKVLHEVFHRFLSEPGDLGVDRLLTVARAELAKLVPWPLARRHWLARLENISDWFVEKEAGRGETFLAGEIDGSLDIPEADFTLNARADQIDRLASGRLALLDYKTGKAPTRAQMGTFDKQLPLEALIAEAGGFDDIPAAKVPHVVHYVLGTKPDYRTEDLIDDAEARLDPDTVRAELIQLILAYRRAGQGYTSRRAMEKENFGSDYEHLARFGEWSDSDEALMIPVGDRP
ncbi:MAG: double-strand break repair protein AddB [Pseudomonadota bacterium]